MRSRRIWLAIDKRPKKAVTVATIDAGVALALEGQGWAVTPGRFVSDQVATKKRGGKR